MENLIIKYCRLADGKDSPRTHASWCELETGLWHSCDCYLGWHREELSILLFRIKHEIRSERG